MAGTSFEEPSVDSPIVSLWSCLEDAEQARTPDTVEFKSVAQITMGIVKNISGKNDSPAHNLARRACVLVYVLLGSPEILQAISRDPVIDNIGGLQRVLGSIWNMVDNRSLYDRLKDFGTRERNKKIRDCEEVLDDFISRFGLLELFKSKIEMVNKATQDRSLLENLLSRPRPVCTIIREGIQGISATVDQGRQDQRTVHEDPPPYPEDNIDISEGRRPFFIYHGDQRIVDASHHTTNMNSGNTRVTTVESSNNDSSARVYGVPRRRDQRY